MKASILVVLGLVIATAASAIAQTSDETAIRTLQNALKRQGHDPGAIDGVMGRQTSAALKAYQKEQRLSVTGRPDAATLKALESQGSTEASAPGAQPTGGDARPSAVDPAQGNKTGANVGEGASYSRSTEKGQSTMTGDGEKK
jgi:peptidoglycan hydrolase-like protein with peptidoglycan-binding domain